MTLENISHIAGVLGLIAVIFTMFLAYKKKLLNTGFTLFRNQYRAEMDEFKNHIRGDVQIFREIMNKNNEQNTKAMDRIVELYESTHSSVQAQANTCKLIRVEGEGSKKLENLWKKSIRVDLDQLQKDVAYLKKVKNGVK